MKIIQKIVSNPAAFVVLLAAILGLIGVIIKNENDKEVARIPIDATSTAEARLTESALLSKSTQTLFFTETPVPAPLDTSTPISTPAPTFTSIPACPYQGKTDHETIVNLIQAEAEASNTKSIAIMQTIFAPDAIFYDEAPNPPKLWVGPLARYRDDLFKTTDFKDVEHFDILPVGQGIAGNMAWYTSGSKGFYKINGGEWQAFSNGSLVSTTPPPTAHGSEHWILEKNSAGCWAIMQMEFNAGHIPFPQ